MADETLTPAPSFRTRLRSTVEAGVLLGVRWAIVLLCVWFALTWIVGDYQTTRANAVQAISFINEYGKPLVDLKRQQQAAPTPAPGKRP